MGSIGYSDLFNHVCDLCLFSYPDVCFSVLFNTLLSVFVCAAANLFVAWVVNAHVFAPYVIVGSTNEL